MKHVHGFLGKSVSYHVLNVLHESKRNSQMFRIDKPSLKIDKLSLEVRQYLNEPNLKFLESFKKLIKFLLKLDKKKVPV